MFEELTFVWQRAEVEDRSQVKLHEKIKILKNQTKNKGGGKKRKRIPDWKQFTLLKVSEHNLN